MVGDQFRLEKMVLKVEAVDAWMAGDQFKVREDGVVG